LCPAFGGDVGQQGIKRKHEDEDDGEASVDALEEILLRTCISKLNVAATAAKGSRRRRTLRHVVLINNMLRSLEHDKPQNVEALSRQRARVTARRFSFDSCLSTSTSRSPDPMSSTSVELSTSSKYDVVSSHEPELQQKPQEHVSSLSWEQEQQLLLPWQPQQLEQLLSFSLDTEDNAEVMSSPTATFCPLLALDMTAGTVSPMFDDMNSSRPDPETLTLRASNPLLDLDCSRPDPEMLDISGDYNAVNFYETVLFHKPATSPGVSTPLNRSKSVSV